jgi:hypothetical protein
MAKQPPAQIVSRLRQKAARARGHANLLVGDQAEQRLKELADEIEQRASALGAEAALATDEAMPSRTDYQGAVTATATIQTNANEYEREHRIRERAYYLWEADGRRPERDEYYWKQAEMQIAAESGAEIK